MKKLLLAWAALAAAPALAAAQEMLPLKHAPTPTVPAITAADLTTRLYIFADDSMLGRRAGEIGGLKGTAYIEREVRRLGLEPAGDSGGYFQNVPLVRRTVAENTSISVGSSTLALWTDYAPMPARGAARAIDGAPIVFGGDLANPQITREQAAGKLVVATADAAGGVLRLRLGPNSPLFQAAGVAVVVPALPEALVARLRQPAFIVTGVASAPVPQAFLVTSHAAELLLGRPLAGTQPGTTAGVVHGSVAFTDTPAPARNVVAVLRGSDTKLRNEYVALGAHNDHLGVGRSVDHDSLRAWNAVMRPQGADTRTPGTPTADQTRRIAAILDSLRKAHPGQRADSVYNGADDDGSGSVAVLEMAEAFANANPKPKRSIIFVWHTGEELGLIGSRWFTDHPTVPRDSIVAQLNMDMVGRGSASDTQGGGPGYLLLVGSRRLSSELGDIVESVNKAEPQPMTFDYRYDADGDPQNIYCRSDHYSYARYGIPITFFTTGLHEDYHQLTDEPEYIDYPHMARVTQLVFDIATRVADLDHRVVIDKPVPGPDAPCRQ